MKRTICWVAMPGLGVRSREHPACGPAPACLPISTQECKCWQQTSSNSSEGHAGSVCQRQVLLYHLCCFVTSLLTQTSQTISSFSLSPSYPTNISKQQPPSYCLQTTGRQAHTERHWAAPLHALSSRHAHNGSLVDVNVNGALGKPKPQNTLLKAGNLNRKAASLESLCWHKKNKENPP